jgi:hypothetical protein
MDPVQPEKQTVDNRDPIARPAYQAWLKGSHPPAVVDSLTRGQ